ncbi:MAG: noncanonical pyrimidine nucleotidase, YjjG family [Ruminococcaceae bacterium]|nr:noncanonical pyrimidine nucleotidase, YjjG family [Oscillospiraceae bacterium]
MRYDIVLFDADGTLFDFLRSEKEAFSKMTAEFGIIVNDELVKSYSEINDSLWKKLEKGEIEKSVLLYHRFEIFCQKHGFVADAKEMAKRYMLNLSELAYFLEGAEELCARLKGKFKMYIVTNGVEYTQKKRYTIAELGRFFEGAFISGEMGAEKPSAEYFEKVAAAIPDFDKARTVIIGDSLSSDIRGGINFGIDTCWYNPNGKPLPEGMKVTHISNSFDDIYDFLCSEGE